MSDIQDKNRSQTKSFIERNRWANTEKTEGNCKRIDVQNGKFSCVVKFYETGTVQVQGAESKVREALLEAKKAIENEENIGEMLPFEIERFPDVLKERIPSIDPIIVRFIEEAFTQRQRQLKQWRQLVPDHQ